MIEKIKEQLEVATDILYKGDANKGMATMTGVIPDIAVVASSIEDAELQGRLMNDALAPILTAMEEKDATLLADLISYELIPILEELE